jgi:hypothetical protein
MERFGMISELEMARLVAVSRLVMGDVPRAHCTHEPHAASLMAGANLFFPEVGSSPRDGRPTPARAEAPVWIPAGEFATGDGMEPRPAVQLFPCAKGRRQPAICRRNIGKTRRLPMARFRQIYSDRSALHPILVFWPLPSHAAEPVPIGTWKTAQTIQPFFYDRFFPIR